MRAGPAILHTIVLCLVLSSAARAAPMPTGELVTPPAGFLRFCVDAPSECAPHVPENAWRPSAEALVSQQRSTAAAATVDWRTIFESARLTRQLAEVSAPPEGSGSLANKPRLLRLLQEVNRHWNTRLRSATDVAIYGRSDVWALPDGRWADCEDYALVKRRDLIRRGVAPHALSLALAKTPQGQSHAVLLISTSDGELVMDNLTDQVLPWEQVGYRWGLRQASGAPWRWVAIHQP